LRNKKHLSVISTFNVLLEIFTMLGLSWSDHVQHILKLHTILLKQYPLI